MKARTYKGFIITPASANSSGIRWHCFGPNGQLRSDTLAGMKQLINSELEKQ